MVYGNINDGGLYWKEFYCFSAGEIQNDRYSIYPSDSVQVQILMVPNSTHLIISCPCTCKEREEQVRPIQLVIQCGSRLVQLPGSQVNK